MYGAASGELLKPVRVRLRVRRMHEEQSQCSLSQCLRQDDLRMHEAILRDQLGIDPFHLIAEWAPRCRAMRRIQFRIQPLVGEETEP